MAMSNLYSKIAPKPIKRNQEQLNMSFSQTHSWMNGKKIFQFLQSTRLHKNIFSTF